MQVGVFPICGGRQKMGGTGVTVGSVPCIHCLPLPARPMGWPIVIGQRINKGGEAVASPLVFDRNYFRKP